MASGVDGRLPVLLAAPTLNCLPGLPAPGQSRAAIPGSSEQLPCLSTPRRFVRHCLTISPDDPRLCSIWSNSTSAAASVGATCEQGRRTALPACRDRVCPPRNRLQQRPLARPSQIGPSLTIGFNDAPGRTYAEIAARRRLKVKDDLTKHFVEQALRRGRHISYIAAFNDDPCRRFDHVREVMKCEAIVRNK
jgi:hypothetical protein